MRLFIEHGEDRDWRGRPRYRLRASLVCEASVLALIERHQLAGDLLWQSPTAVALSEAAEGLFDNARELSLFGRGNVAKALQWNVRGLRLARQASREVRVTVGDLVGGIALQSRALGELLAAEGGIAAAFDALAAQLETLAGYEAGDELLIEPAREDDDRGTPPAGWVRMTGRG